MLYRRLARELARMVGVQSPNFVGQQASEIALAARQTLLRQRNGLVVFHFPDADRAGHAHGWMSEQYAAAARGLDATIGMVRAHALDRAPDDTLLVVCADHGGGGAIPTDHESDHYLDRTIPIILAGGGVRPGVILGDATILDLPATILGALGVERPDGYTGRVLEESLVELQTVG